MPLSWLEAYNKRLISAIAAFRHFNKPTHKMGGYKLPSGNKTFQKSVLKQSLVAHQSEVVKKQLSDLTLSAGVTCK